MDKVRVLLVDDHALFREGMHLMLNAHDDFHVVGEASNADEAIQAASKLNPDIIVMDISMNGNGLNATRRILQTLPKTKILILTMHGDEGYFFRALEAGAVGYVVKGATSSELLAALRAVSNGEIFLHPSVAGYLVTDYLGRVGNGEERESYANLSGREKEVLQLIAHGNTNQEIANQLHISFHTVQTHRGHIMDKLNLHSRSDLVKYAIRLGFLKPL